MVPLYPVSSRRLVHSTFRLSVRFMDLNSRAKNSLKLLDCTLSGAVMV